MTNCLETTVLCYTPRPPVWVGDNRSCKFGPHNVAYEGLREQLEEAGLMEGGSYGPNMWNAAVDIDRNFGQHGAPGSPKGEEDIVPFSTITVPPPEFNVRPLPVAPTAEYRLTLSPSPRNALSSPSGRPPNDENTHSNGRNNGSPASSSSAAPGPANIYTHILAGLPYKLPPDYHASVHARLSRVASIRSKIAASGLSGADLARLEHEIDVGFKGWLVGRGEVQTITDLMHS